MSFLQDRRMRLLHIYFCRGSGLKTITKMVNHDPTLAAVYRFSVDELRSTYKMNRKQAEMFHYDLRHTSIKTLLEGTTLLFKIVTRFDKDYPKLLEQLFDPPWVLFYRGDLSLVHHDKTLAVVGSRFPTPHAHAAMKQILSPLIRSGWCIISGLAYGIDAIGHQLALAEKGNTIAVLGSGIKRIYPPEHRELAENIAQYGLLLSEFLPDQPPQRWQFPFRNRLISGLARGTLVVEARERSGSLITADQALEQGREVFALPGSILSENSRGTNLLIQQGAKLVTSANDIKNEFQFDKS